MQGPQDIHSTKLEFWRQRFSIRIAPEWDENSPFFHAAASGRRRKNTIACLEVDGTCTTAMMPKALSCIIFTWPCTRNWMALQPVDTVFFFWHVSRKVIFVNRRWPIQKKSKDAHSWDRPMGVRPMDQRNMPWRCWSAGSGIRPIEKLPMKSRKEKRIRTRRKSWWFGCNILGSLSFK